MDSWETIWLPEMPTKARSICTPVMRSTFSRQEETEEMASSIEVMTPLFTPTEGDSAAPMIWMDSRPPPEDAR